MKFFFLAGLVVFSASCVNPRWNDYDVSQHSISMNPGVESLQSHVDFLRNWSESEEGMPPGLAAEFGYYLSLMGLKGEAETWFEREVSAHPNSTKFVDSLRSLTMGKGISDSGSQEEK